MQTENLIRAEAQQVRITKLRKGDVFRIMEKEYSSSDYQAKYGVVLNIFNDGVHTFFETLLYSGDFWGVKCKPKLFSGKDDVILFPATAEEVEDTFRENLERMEKDILSREDDLNKSKAALSLAKEFVSGQTKKKLSDSQYLVEKAPTGVDYGGRL